MSVESIVNRLVAPLARPRNAVLAIIIVAIASRIVSWWNPVAHVDDQFYMLAGYDLLHGRWPYLEVWDRKPLGLFLLYAGISAIGGTSVLVLNIIATAFAAATALVIRQIASRYASAASAALAALTYLFIIPLYGGQNGQTPVFYNLLIAGSVLILLRAFERSVTGQAIRSAFLAMFLCGLAMTVKPTSVAEGTFVGLGFLWLFRRLALPWIQIFALASGMIMTAVLPTALSYLSYRLAGPEAADAFIYANFISIFERENFQALARIAGFALLLLYLFPLMIMAGIGLWRQWRNHAAAPLTILLSGWVSFALLGYLTVPSFFDHYALPIIPALCVATAIFYDLGSGRLFFFGYLAFCLIEGTMLDGNGNRVEAMKYDRIRTTVEAARNGGCVYVADGPSRLYLDFPACRPTRFLFPDHLMLRTEAGAIGVSPQVELRRILDEHPAVIVARRIGEGRRLPDIQHMLYSTLETDYRRVLIIPEGMSASVDGVEVWQRKKVAPQPQR